MDDSQLKNYEEPVKTEGEDLQKGTYANDTSEAGALKKELGLEAPIFIVIFLAFFIAIGSVMGGTNMIKTMMLTGFDLLLNTCFYLMAIAVLAGGISGLLSEFGVISLINRGLAVVMKPVYDLPGAASLGVLQCFLSDNPAVLTLAQDDNFRQYFKKYQLPALTNLATAFGMGLIVITTVMALPVEDSIKSAFVGLAGAVFGSIVSVRIMIPQTKKRFGTEEMVPLYSESTIPEGYRQVREGSAFTRFIQAVLDGGKVGVDMGLTIIPGVVIICTLVLLLTNGPGAGGVYDGSAGQGVPVLPWIGQQLNFILKPLFGFSNPEAVAVPITAMGSSGAAVGLISTMAESGVANGNDLAVFTAMCMCWSGYLSTHIAMMDALDTKEMTSAALISHTFGGLAAGIFAHFLWLLVS